MSLEFNDGLRVLVVSNNAFSLQNNNGKTLHSFFRKIPSKNMGKCFLVLKWAIVNWPQDITGSLTVTY